MTLYDDAYAEYGTRNQSLTYTYNSINYNPYDFVSNAFLTLFASCINENGVGQRAVFIPKTTQPTNMTNTAVISMIRGAYFIIQRNWDAYLAIINQITGGTITSQPQISPAWDAYLSTYSNNRIIEPTNESLSASIVPQIQSDWNQTNSASLDFIKNKPTRIQSSASRPLNSVFQISATKDCLVSYSVDISSSITLATGQSGTVFLEIASDSGFTSNVQELGRFVNGISGTLAVGLNLVQDVTGTLSGYVPAGYYCRMRTANNTGTPTFNYRSGQEITF